jgi:hypothetical protein
MKYICWIILLLPFWSKAQQSSIDPQWLLGDWMRVYRGDTLIESWSRQSDSLYIGSAYKKLGADKQELENVKLIRRNGVWFYEAKVEKQNAGRTIPFKAKRGDENFMLFENEEHDFPNAISYRRVHADSLVAVISGYFKGNIKDITFPMSRIGSVPKSSGK